MHDTRIVLDTIIQSASVDLFHSFGLAVAPIARSNKQGPPQFHELAASIGFNGRGFSGVLLICVPSEAFALIKQDPQRPFTGRDWAREVANQLLGRIKSRLLQFQVCLQSGLPSALTRDGFEQQRARGKISESYAFRTLRGDITVTLAGDIDYSLFVYSGSAAVPAEGDVIIF